MLVVFVGVRAHAEFRAHLGVNAILILLVKFNNRLEDITRVLVNLVELASESKHAVSLDVVRACISRCNQDAAEYCQND